MAEGSFQEVSKVLLLEQSSIFSALDEAGRVAILEKGKIEHYLPGQVICREGEPGLAFYLIKRGTVKVTTAMSGAPVELARLQRGTFFGEVALLSGKPRTATAEAIDEVELIALSKSVIDEMVKEYPPFKGMLEEVVVGRAHDTIDKILNPRPSTPEPPPPPSVLPSLIPEPAPPSLTGRHPITLDGDPPGDDGKGLGGFSRKG